MKMIISILLASTIIFVGCNGENDSAQKQTASNYENEKQAIMDVIHEEYKAYFIKDYEAWQSKFIHQDYLKYWGFWDGYPEKVRQYNSWNEVDTDKKKRMAGETKAYWDENQVGMDIRDLNVQIRGDVAWVTFKQVSTDQETGEFLGEALETKIMEKENGQWKIAYLNFLYLPTEQSEQ